MFDENITGDQIQAKRLKVKKDYQELYSLVSEILFRHDPVGINFETNDDEYEPEVDTILPRLKECDSVKDVLNAVHQEIIDWFDEDIAGDKENYIEIANEIWNLRQFRKFN